MIKKKYPLYLATLSAALYLGIALIPRLSTQAQAQSQPIAQAVSASFPESVHLDFKSPPTNGEPKQSGTTGTRGGCASAKGSLPFLTPLTPGTIQGLTEKKEGTVSEYPTLVSEYPTLTISEYPTFFVYVPQTSAHSVEFVLTDENNTREIYYKAFAFPSNPGIVSVTLPADKPPLEIGKVYKWSFIIICKPEEPSQNITVYGWVKRTEPNPALVKALEKATPLERAALYGEYGIWHETLTTLANLRRSQPEESTLVVKWTELLKSEPVKLSAISQAPLVDCCTSEN